MHKALLNSILLLLSQVGGYLIPLLEIPLLSRALGAEAMGEVIFIQGLALTASLFVEYGFNLNASKEIAQAENCRHRHSDIYNKVASTKILITFFVIFILFTAHQAGLLKELSSDQYYLYAIIGFLAFGFSPFWYFQGIEHLKLITFIDLAIRFTALFILYIFISSPEHGPLVVLIQCMAGLIITVITNFMALKRIGKINISLQAGIQGMKEGWNFFIFKSSGNLLVSLNTVILGALTNMQAVAYFSGAEKVIKAMTGLSLPILNAFYPVFSRNFQYKYEDTKRDFKIFFSIVMTASLVGYAIIYYLSEKIIYIFLGDGFERSIEILQVLIALLPLRVATQSLSIGYLLPNDRAREASYIMILAAALNMALALILIPLLGIEGLVYSALTSEAFLLISFLYFSLKTNSVILLRS